MGSEMCIRDRDWVVENLVMFQSLDRLVELHFLSFLLVEKI